MKTEKISVIVPVYRVEKYIHKCIDSILSQTYRNLEIILVDDESPDLCPQICEEYAKIDSRIRVIHQKNGGLSCARNAGIEIASGDYIAFVDGDDYIHPDMIRKLYSALTEAKADFSVCNVQYTNEDGSLITKYPNNIIKNNVLTRDEVFQESFGNYGYYYIIVCNKLYKKKLWEKYRFSEGKFHEDEFSFHHIMIQSNKAACIGDAYYYYIQHDGSIMSEKNFQKSADAMEAFIERMNFFKDHNMLEFLLLQDQKCFWDLQKVYDLCNSKNHKKTYCILKKKYYEIHKWVIQNASYPKYLRIKIWVYYYCPYSKNIYNIIKKYLRKIKYQLFYVHITLQSKAISMRNHNVKRIYFISTPTHGNMGDQAIVYAQYQLMQEVGIHKNVIEITRKVYEQLREKLEKVIQSGDLIIIDGGGNIGTLWIEEEEKMRDIVKRFPMNPIFIFPQTAYYDETPFGQQELKKSASVYNSHARLIIFCRDKVTYDLVQEKFTEVKSFYTPDMVPFIQNAQIPKERTGILFCFREDLESVCPRDFKDNLERKLAAKGYVIKESSTLIEGRVGKKSRVKKLREKWGEFLSSRLVITDRLHGMIFCAITGTPCIALDNVSHKVRDGYEWIQYLPYILYCGKDLAKIEEHVDYFMKNNQEYHYDRKPLEPYYVRIKDEVKHAFNQK